MNEKTFIVSIATFVLLADFAGGLALGYTSASARSEGVIAELTERNGTLEARNKGLADLIAQHNATSQQLTDAVRLIAEGSSEDFRRAQAIDDRVQRISALAEAVDKATFRLVEAIALVEDSNSSLRNAGAE